MSFDITIAGELNLDLILYGLPHELPPERELLANDMTLTLGSSSAILAHNLAALGSKVGFVSRIGPDELGLIALKRLKHAGVDIAKVVRRPKGNATGLTVIVSHQHGRRMLTYPGAMFEMCRDDIDLDYLASGKHFHLSSFFLHRALRKDIPEIFRELRSRGLSTSLDTNDDPDDLWDGVLPEVLKIIDLLLINENEALKIAQTKNLDKAVDALSRRVPTLVVKMGSKGALAARAGKRTVVPAVPVHVVDAVGAGDSFNAGFLQRYVRGESLETCLQHGNVVGAFSATGSGGTEAFRDRAKMLRFFKEHAVH